MDMLSVKDNGVMTVERMGQYTNDDDKKLEYCNETATFYEYKYDCELPVTGTTVLATGTRRRTRWVAIAGKFYATAPTGYIATLVGEYIPSTGQHSVSTPGDGVMDYDEVNDILVVGDVTNNTVHVYHGDVHTLLTGSGAFGCSVSAQGGVVVVGANISGGNVHIYDCPSPGVVNLIQTLSVSEFDSYTTQGQSNLGTDVVIRDGIIIASAPGHTTSSDYGLVLSWSMVGATWEPINDTVILTHNTTRLTQQHRLDYNGNTLVVGSDDAVMILQGGLVTAIVNTTSLKCVYINDLDDKFCIVSDNGSVKYEVLSIGSTPTVLYTKELLHEYTNHYPNYHVSMSGNKMTIGWDTLHHNINNAEGGFLLITETSGVYAEQVRVLTPLDREMLTQYTTSVSYGTYVLVSNNHMFVACPQMATDQESTGGQVLRYEVVETKLVGTNSHATYNESSFMSPYGTRVAIDKLHADIDRYYRSFEKVNEYAKIHDGVVGVTMTNGSPWSDVKLGVGGVFALENLSIVNNNLNLTTSNIDTPSVINFTTGTIDRTCTLRDANTTIRTLLHISKLDTAVSTLTIKTSSSVIVELPAKGSVLLYATSTGWVVLSNTSAMKLSSISKSNIISRADEIVELTSDTTLPTNTFEGETHKLVNVTYPSTDVVVTSEVQILGPSMRDNTLTLAGDESCELYWTDDVAVFTLAQAALVDDTTFTLTDSTGVKLGRWATVNSETVMVTAVAGNVITIGRGVNSTTAVGHSSGATLTMESIWRVLNQNKVTV